MLCASLSLIFRLLPGRVRYTKERWQRDLGVRETAVMCLWGPGEKVATPTGELAWSPPTGRRSCYFLLLPSSCARWHGSTGGLVTQKRPSGMYRGGEGGEGGEEEAFLPLRKPFRLGSIDKGTCIALGPVRTAVRFTELFV